MRVEQFRRGVGQCAAAGEPGRVDQAVHPAELGDRGRDRGPRLGDVPHVGLDEHRLGPGPGQFGGHGLARLAPPAGDRDQRTLAGRGPGDAGAKALGGPADQDHAAGEQAHPALTRRLDQAASSASSRGRGQSSATARARMPACVGGAIPSTG